MHSANSNSLQRHALHGIARNDDDSVFGRDDTAVYRFFKAGLGRHAAAAHRTRPVRQHRRHLFIRQYLQSAMPTELIEAAKIDGCSFPGIFFKIALPIMKPALAARRPRLYGHLERFSRPVDLPAYA